MSKKVMQIELAAESPSFTNGYYYADLMLPAEEHEILDAMQRVRGIGRNEKAIDISIRSCEYLPELEDTRIDGITIKELNFLAKRLSQLNEDEIMVLGVIAPRYLPGDGELIEMKTLINLTYGLQDVSVISNVYSDDLSFF